MKELGHLKTYKMKLTTLSPVFIGGGEFSDYSNLQYVFDKNTDELKIIDEDKFMKFLINTNNLDNFIKYVSEPQYNSNGKKIASNLSGWINKNFANKSLDIYSRTEKIDQIATRGLHCIRSFVKDINESPYIPGSSIKGAIRTAIYADLLKNNKNHNEVKEILKKEMSYIHISDSKPFAKKSLMYRQTQHQQLVSDKDLMNVDNDLKEILREGVISFFTITIDKNSLYNIEKILNCLNNFYGEVLKENIVLDSVADDLKTYINVTGCPPNINIGGQSGFNAKVILKVLSSDFSEYMQKKKEILNKAFRKHNHLTAKIAPRCIRVVERFKENDDTLMPLGWCNIAPVED